MKDLKSQFIQSAKDSKKKNNHALDRAIVEKITSELLQDLHYTITKSNEHEITIDLKQYVFDHYPKDEDLHDVIDVNNYAEAICKEIKNHSDMFRKFSAEDVRDYLEYTHESADDFINSIESKQGEEHDEAIASNIRKICNTMSSPDRIIYEVIWNKNDECNIYFNWKDFQKSVVDGKLY